jgi:hypothetical protein
VCESARTLKVNQRRQPYIDCGTSFIQVCCDGEFTDAGVCVSASAFAGQLLVVVLGVPGDGGGVVGGDDDTRNVVALVDARLTSGSLQGDRARAQEIVTSTSG